MADNGPTLDDVEGFVAELEAAATVNDPRLHAYWDIIVLLQENLVYLGTDVIRPFNAYIGIPPHHRAFAERAYRWLRMHHSVGTTRYALSRIGPTKPGLVAQTRQGMMPHELSSSRRKTRVVCSAEQQAFPAKITSETMVWATDGALKSITATTPRPETLQDIPKTFGQMLPYVRLMADALKDRSDMIDNEETSHQVRLVKCTSGPVYEDVAWFFMFKARDAQEGKPGVYPWATSFHWREYETFRARWDDLVEFVRTSKGAVANLLICPHDTRFACDPASELQTKKGNKRTNGHKAAWKAAADAALEQLAAAANAGGADNGAGGHALVQPGAANQAIPQPVGNPSNVVQHVAHENNQQNDFGNNHSSQQPAQGTSLVSGHGALSGQHLDHAAALPGLPLTSPADAPVPMGQQEPGIIQGSRSDEGLDEPDTDVDAVEEEQDVSLDEPDSANYEDSYDEDSYDEDSYDEALDDEDFDNEDPKDEDSNDEDPKDEDSDGEGAGNYGEGAGQKSDTTRGDGSQTTTRVPPATVTVGTPL